MKNPRPSCRARKRGRLNTAAVCSLPLERRNSLGAAKVRKRRFGRRVRRTEPNGRAALVAVIQLIKSGRFTIPFVADRTGHSEVTIRHWLNGSTLQPQIDTLLNVAGLYGVKSMRTLCTMTPDQIAEAQRRKHRRINLTTSRPRWGRRLR
jgi:hypothetical protein